MGNSRSCRCSPKVQFIAQPKKWEVSAAYSRKLQTADNGQFPCSLLKSVVAGACLRQCRPFCGRGNNLARCALATVLTKRNMARINRNGDRTVCTGASTDRVESIWPRITPDSQNRTMSCFQAAPSGRRFRQQNRLQLSGRLKSLLKRWKSLDTTTRKLDDRQLCRMIFRSHFRRTSISVAARLRAYSDTSDVRMGCLTFLRGVDFEASVGTLW